ncbi:DUF6814 family protein [Flaviaesturariibacter terrae]
MNALKRYSGLLWMLLAPLVLYVLFSGALRHIDPAGNKDINKPIPWLIIIVVFTPIAVGLAIFGWYAWKGEYDRLPEDPATRSARD